MQLLHVAERGVSPGPQFGVVGHGDWRPSEEKLEEARERLREAEIQNRQYASVTS